MAAETFFARWARVKAETCPAPVPEPLLPVAIEAPAGGTPSDATLPAAAVDSGAAEGQPAPSLEQVAQLTPDSDFTPFVARGVDETVRRAALKKLFADPHFNVMDGLDTYIDDYNKFEPLTPLMVAALNHAKDLIAREFTAEDDNEPENEDL